MCGDWPRICIRYPAACCPRQKVVAVEVDSRLLPAEEETLAGLDAIVCETRILCNVTGSLVPAEFDGRCRCAPTCPIYNQPHFDAPAGGRLPIRDIL